MVVKRDGRVVKFDGERVYAAVIKAMNECGINDERLAETIAEKTEKKCADKDVGVEQIQDWVEEYLMASKYKDVARAYIKYRDKRNTVRERNAELHRKIKNILECNNTQNSNANVDEFSYSGRKFESANAMHKNFALNEYMSPEVAEAHKEGRIYNHDLSEYNVGSHNCLFADVAKLLNNGFTTRNGDVRPANSFSTACQLVAVIFQIQSQVQFGGCASAHLDYDLASFVRKSFAKKLRDGIRWVEGVEPHVPDEVGIADPIWSEGHPAAHRYAMSMLVKELAQSCQGLFHNLNTLESRAGSQVPFTSINFGRDTSPEGRMVIKHLLEASLDGIGKHHRTPIFPISIFNYKKGVNDKPGTPNYDMKQLAIKSLSKRIYPNIVNGDWSRNVDDPDNPDTYMATMGCRTLLGKDRHGLGYSKIGRGNVCPVTMNLPAIGINHGICLGERTEPDLDGFWAELDEVLALTEKALIDRFYHICSQSVKSAPFMYDNGTIADAEAAREKGIYEAMKHGTLAIGYIGIAEMCKALFGKYHDEDEDVLRFAVSVVEHIANYVNEAAERNNLNFSCYATPAESLCKTFAESLKKKYGVIEGVCDREYITNSHHVPVWEKVSIYRKLEIEAQFCKYPTGGCITYIELESSVVNNHKAIEDIIDYAMSLDIPYLAFNFPIDSCLACGYQGEIEENCPACNGTNIERLRRVTGYLTTDYRNFNDGKIAECLDRVKHSKYTEFK